MRYFVHLSYDGTEYSGWQWQANTLKTIQATLNNVIGKMIKTPDIVLNGCGRTDAGVHASQYFIHFDTEVWLDEEEFVFIANKQLPSAVTVHELIPIHDKAHCRYDASNRTYHYFIHKKPDPILSRHSALYDLPELNIDAIQKAAAKCIGNLDYASLCRKPDKHNTTMVDMRNITVAADANQERIQFSMTANRFLKSQVRIMVDEFLLIGQGKSTLEAFQRKLEGNEKRTYENMVYPQGLHLSEVQYPYLKINNASKGFEMLLIGDNE